MVVASSMSSPPRLSSGRRSLPQLLSPPQSPGHQRFGHRPAGSVQGKKEVGQWGPEELDVQYRFVCFMMVAKLVRSYVVSKKQAKIG